MSSAQGVPASASGAEDMTAHRHPAPCPVPDVAGGVCDPGHMDQLPGAEDVGAYLKRTCLRDFGPPPDGEADGESYRATLDRDDVPVPRLLRSALVIAGFAAYGPGEKVEWWVNFTYRGHPCALAHEKFGVRLYVHTDSGEDAAADLSARIVRKLLAAVRAVEKLIVEAAPQLLGRGEATVANQHHVLRRAFDYFRDRAEHPTFIPDVKTEYQTPPGLVTKSFGYSSGGAHMAVNAFHDLVAALTAYVSALEHALVLALPFRGFDPDKEDLTGIIGARWGEKWERVLGKDEEANTYRARLAEVVERWRNPYSHGGFEKGHGSTIYLHTPGVGAVPIGLTGVRSSPRFTLFPASESDIGAVFVLLDELDTWLSIRLPEAMRWINSGLPVRYDEAFRTDLTEALAVGRFERFLEYHSYRQDQVDNMDYQASRLSTLKPAHLQARATSSRTCSRSSSGTTPG